MTPEQQLTEKLKTVMGEAPPEFQTAFASPPPQDTVKGLDVQSVLDWIDKFDPSSLDTFVTVLGVVSVIWPPAGAIAAGLRAALPWITKLLPLIKEALQLFGVNKTMEILGNLST